MSGPLSLLEIQSTLEIIGLIGLKYGRLNSLGKYGAFMARQRRDIGKKRREQIVEAAVAVIAAEGLQNLSLSAIEKRASMSRGQLTYYYKTKDEILLAVFDRMIDLMHRQHQAGEMWDGQPMPSKGWERFQTFLELFLLHPPVVPEFHALQYTFLSQIGHRDDLRRRLADLYDTWRTRLADDLYDVLVASGKSHGSARTLATLIQGMLHGLAMQREADPSAFDPREMLAMCRDLLSGYLGNHQPEAGKLSPHRAAVNMRGKPKAGAS